jgi:hypothetical protein
MRTGWLRSAALAALLAAGACALPAAGGEDKAKDTFVVHEWGTFLSVQGSDGGTLGGMVDSEEELPPFVRERDLDGWSRAYFNEKMETPVTYFYTDQPRKVQFRVDMPRGLLTHWFPSVKAFGPKKDARANPADGSFLDWGEIEVVPDRTPVTPKVSGAKPPRTPTFYEVNADSTWKFVRETDSALVKFNFQGKDRVEKFLFYRGLAAFELPLEVRSAGPDGDLRLLLRNRGDQQIRGLFAVRVVKDGIRYGTLGDLAERDEREVDAGAALGERRSFRDGVPAAKDAVAEALVKAGLYPKEARAMVNNWEKSYFRTEGLRLLSVVPRSQVDEVIPLKIKPAPDDLVRVMVGRVEVLTPDAEARVAEQVAKSAAGDGKVREDAVTELNRLGRLREPVLRRILAASKSAEVRAQAEKLITSKTAEK